MESIVAAVVVAALIGCHLRNRRHPGWRASAEGRLDIYCGYALVAIAVYWLVSAPTATGFEWALGNLWTLAAMLAFVAGFGALNRVTTEHASAAQVVESLEPPNRTPPRQEPNGIPTGRAHRSPPPGSPPP